MSVAFTNGHGHVPRLELIYIRHSQEELQSLREELVDKLTQHETEVAQLIFRISTAEARQQESVQQFFQERKALDVGELILRDNSRANRIINYRQS